MSHCFTLVSPSPSHLPLVVVVACVLFVYCFPVFCKCLGGVLFIPPRVLDDRQCFTARSARQKKPVVHQLAHHYGQGSISCEKKKTLMFNLDMWYNFVYAEPIFLPDMMHHSTQNHGWRKKLKIMSQKLKLHGHVRPLNLYESMKQ